MAQRSAYFSAEPAARSRSESRFELTFAGVLALAGLTLLAIPLPRAQNVAAFTASWLSFICLLLSLLRPAAYGKGMADGVLGIIAAFGYGLVGWLAGNAGQTDPAGYRLVLFAAFAFGGVARLLVFLRMLSVQPLPVLAADAAVCLLVALLILMEIPSGSRMLWWYVGMLFLTDAAELTAQAAALRRFSAGRSRHAE